MAENINCDIIVTMFKLDVFLSQIVKYGLYAILLTPLAFWPGALYGFMTPKFLLFQVLVEIVFGAWLILKLIDFQNVRNRAFNIKFSWLTISLLIFTAISFISALLGVDFSRSVWGIGARMTGLFAEFHFLAWLLVLVSISKSSVDFRSPTSRSPEVGLLKPDFDIVKYLNFSFGVSILVALTAFYQNISWHIVYGYTTFSNPTFVAPYFLFHFFWGVYQFFSLREISRRETIFKKWLFGIGVVLIGVALVMGQVRGAIIGFLAGILFVSIFLIFSNILRKRYRIFNAVFIMVVVLGLTMIFIFKNSAFVKSRSYLDRISHISLNETTAQTRILIWQSALKGFFDRLILGVGPENFNYLFNANYNPRLLMFGSIGFAETWQDKPHNAFIEILAETGVIGGLAYIAIWLCVAYCLFKIFKKGDKFLSLFLAAAFISYFGAVFFSFDSFGSWFGLFLFFAILILSRDDNTEIIIDKINLNKVYKNIIVLAGVLIILFLLLVNYAIWMANLTDAAALRIFSQNPKAGIALFEKSFSYKSPYKPEYQFDLIASIGGAVEKGMPLDDLENTINFILDEADKAILAHPNNASGYTDMLRIYNILGTKGRDPIILEQAEIFGQKSLELSPNRQETLFYLARTALLKNNTKLAVQLTKQAVDIDSTINTSHWYLGLSYIADSQTHEGVLEIKRAMELGYKPQNQKEIDFVKSLGL